jgi:hypothetical protein
VCAMQRVGLVVLPDFQPIYLAALSVFAFANIGAKKTLYEIEILSENRGDGAELPGHDDRHAKVRGS